MKMFIGAILFALCSLGLAAKCSAAEGNDLLIGGDGVDLLRGGAGNDVLLSQIAKLELDLKAAEKERQEIGLLLPAVQKVRDAAARMKSLDRHIADLRAQIGALEMQLERK